MSKYRFSEINKVPFGLEYENIDFVSSVHSELHPKTKISLESYLTNSIKLNTPMLSSPMPNVTGPEMCIALGLEGGMGVIPKGISIEEQVKQGKKVKKFSSGFISEPEVLSPQDPIYKALEIKKQRGFSTIPVTENGKPHGKAVGLLVKYGYSEKYKDDAVKDRMLTLENLNEKGILHYKMPTLKEAEDIMRQNNFGKLVILDEEGHLNSIATWADVSTREEHPYATLDREGRIMYGFAVGGPGSPGDLKERTKKMIEEAEADVIFVETAQADSRGVMKLTKEILDDFTQSYNIPVVWGNVDNDKSAERLASKCNDNDAIKVGIGPGSICTTKQVTGFGYPQVSAVYECSKVSRRYGLKCIADGGLGNTSGVASGNIVKALCAGADTVMLGGLFAGTDESPGEVKEIEGRKVKEYFGMSSIKGLKLGGNTRYYEDVKDAVIQGKEMYTPYTGSVYDIVHEVNKNLRYTMRVHANAKKIPELYEADMEFTILPHLRTTNGLDRNGNYKHL